MALTKAIVVAAQRVGGGEKLDFDEWVGYSATMFLGKACRGFIVVPSLCGRIAIQILSMMP
jgi:hypothetical protein